MMQLNTIIVATLALLGSVNAVPTVNQLSQVKSTLANLVNSNPRDFVPGFIRLSFHGCMAGGCHGCIDLNVNSNRGLQNRVNALATIYPSVSSFMSLADLYALAGQVAIEQGMIRAGGSPPLMTPLFGRTDNGACIGTTVFPNDQGNGTALFSFFASQFPSLSVTDVVALMGTHGSGRVSKQNSGFTFPRDAWHPPSFGLVDNAYYSRVQAQPWTQQDNGASDGVAHHWIWNQNNNNGMLNPDIALVRDFQVVDGFGQSSCTFNTCPHAGTLPLVRQFTNDRTSFYQALAVAYSKMVSNGYTFGQLIGVDGPASSVTTKVVVSTKSVVTTKSVVITKSVVSTKSPAPSTKSPAPKTTQAPPPPPPARPPPRPPRKPRRG